MITSEFLATYDGQTPPWGYGGMGEVVMLRTYSRPVEGEDRNETWAEVCQRSVNGAIAIGADLNQEDAELLFHHMFNLRCSVSGRGLWQLGTPLVEKQGGASLNNCFYTDVETIEDFEFIFDMLMVGGGVGFSVERSKIHELPKVKAGVQITHERTDDADVIVPDKREGWSRLVHSVLKSYFYTGKSFSYSTLLLREYGAPLKTFGGTASGPGALIEGIENICQVLDNRVGKKLRSIDVLDIVNIIGAMVVAGSSRRSAQIAIGDPDDVLFLRAKNWGTGKIPAWRGNSNNSIYADGYDEIPAELWKGYTGEGEPYGLINRKLARKVGRLGEANPDPSIEGFNPCVTADTWILTDQGAKQVKDLREAPFTALVDGKPYQATAFWETGTKPVLQVETHEGYSVRATADHKILTPNGWVEAGLLEPGDQVVIHDHLGASWVGEGAEDEGYLLGHLVGDGTFTPEGRAQLAVWSTDPGSAGPARRILDIAETMSHRSDFQGWRATGDGNQSRLTLASITELAKSFGIERGSKTVTDAIEGASSSFYVGFLQGLFDTDGHIEGHPTQGGISIRLSQSDQSMLLRVQRMLARLGVRSSVRPMYPEGVKPMPGGEYLTQASFRLIIAGEQAARFMSVVGFSDESKAAKWFERSATMKRGFYNKPSVATVAEIVEDGSEPVYDCTVDDVHAFDANGIYVHNCAEIGLASGESCNLATIFLPNVRSFEEFCEISRLLYLVQKTVTELKYPYDKTTKIVRANRRLGQNVTGMLQCTEEQMSWLSPGYDALRELDAKYSAMNNLPESIRLTTVQPGGTLPTLPGVLSATGPAFAPYFYRRVRFGSNDPLLEALRERGHHIEYDVNIDGSRNHTRQVVTFPCKAPEGAKLTSEVTAIDQLEMVKHMQTVWADNAVSCTVYYRPEELDDIKVWLEENYDDSVKSVSFLLHKDHGFALPPLEECTEAEYERMVASIDLSVPLVKSSDDLLLEDCATGACPIR